MRHEKPPRPCSKSFILDLFLLASVLLLLTTFSCSRNGSLGARSATTNLSPTWTMACITKMETGEHWGELKSGARAAAGEAQATIEFSAPANEGDFTTQEQLVQDAINHDVDAIIIAVADAEGMGESLIRARSKGIVVVTVDATVQGVPVDCRISSDNLRIGIDAATHALSTQTQLTQVVVFASIPESSNIKDRLKGLSETFDTRGVPIGEIVYTGADEKVAKQSAMGILPLLQNISHTALIALDEQSSIGLAQACMELSMQPALFIASGSSIQEISLLETGVIDALLVENSFNMGYLGVMQAIKALKQQKPAEDITTEHAVVTKESLRTIEHQRLAFPIY